MSLSDDTKEKLVALADLLSKVKAKSFNLALWKNTTPCGTTACAVGHAAQDAWFQDRGLSISWYIPAYTAPDGNVYSDWDAVMAFFGLNQDQAVFLFNGHYYDNKDLHDPLAVRGRILSFIQADGVVNLRECTY